MPEPDENNGHDLRQVMTEATALAALDQHIRHVVEVMHRGIFSSVSGFAPEVVVKAIARVTGEQLGNMVCIGDLQNVFRVRNDLVEDFKRSIRAAKIIPPLPEARDPLRKPS